MNGFRGYLEKIKPGLDAAVERTLAEMIGDDQGKPAAALTGGKRIRGGLLCLICEASGGAMDAAMDRAVAVELIHAASLIHDDFVDQDVARRKMPAAWTLEGARRAVLLGDLIFASAIAMMSDAGREDGLVVSTAIAKLAKGAYHEQTDPAALADLIENRGFDPGLYETIISLKTGVLFGAACQLGGLAGGATPEAREKILRYGLKLGEAYQIADDLKEVRHHLLTRSADSGAMAELAPAVLYFCRKAGPELIHVLRGESAELSAGFLRVLATIADLMEREIETRLAAATAAVSDDFSRNGFAGLVKNAPREIVDMFNEQ